MSGQPFKPKTMKQYNLSSAKSCILKCATVIFFMSLCSTQAIAQKSRSASKNKISSGTTQGISAGTTTNMRSSSTNTYSPLAMPTGIKVVSSTTTNNKYESGALNEGISAGTPINKAKSKNNITYNTPLEYSSVSKKKSTSKQLTTSTVDTFVRSTIQNKTQTPTGAGYQDYPEGAYIKSAGKSKNNYTTDPISTNTYFHTKSNVTGNDFGKPKTRGLPRQQ